ncbi:MAG: long-chain fatty acid--CoA ligase [Betaproteobacteria bacterium]|nr:MAG: long-chain fatty acid--CoA ligase [Betaproteobacteria bacterium]
MFCMTVDGFLSASALRWPSKLAVVASGRSLSYAQLDADVSRFARALVVRGVQPGDRVSVILPNSLEMVVAFYAISRCGAVLVPLNPAYTDHELTYILGDAGASVVICRRSHTGRLHALKASIGLREFVEIDDIEALSGFISGQESRPVKPPEDVTTHSILYTSGTTGRPKGAVMSHWSRIYNSLTCQIGYEIDSDTRMNCAPPLFHSGAMLLAMINVIAAGGALLVPTDAGPDSTRRAMEEHGANYLLAVPTIIRRLVDDAAFSAVARSRSFSLMHGGAGMPIALAEQFMQDWPQCRPFHAYGATESPQLTVLPPDEYGSNLGATGRALPGMDVRVCRQDGSPVAPGELGEIVTSGPHILDRYLNQPEATAQRIREGAFWTGDIATTDERGLVTISGRSSDLIISGGLNVYAREVEDVLHAVPGVAHAAVFGMPDPEWGEAVSAAVVLKAGAKLSADALIEACRQRLASYKKPRHIWFVEGLPLTPAGKVQKFKLVEQFSKK